MSKPIKKITLALLASTIGLSAVPTHAAPPPEPVSVGILDVHAAKLPKSDKNTQIEYREFRDRGQTAARWPVAENLDHGQLVAGAFVYQVRKIDKDVPIRIVAANIFHENTPAAAPKSYKIAGMAVTTRYVDQEGSARLMPQIAMRPLPASLAKGPVADMPTLAVAQIPAVSAER